MSLIKKFGVASLLVLAMFGFVACNNSQTSSYTLNITCTAEEGTAIISAGDNSVDQNSFFYNVTSEETSIAYITSNSNLLEKLSGEVTIVLYTSSDCNSISIVYNETDITPASETMNNLNKYSVTFNVDKDSSLDISGDFFFIL